MEKFAIAFVIFTVSLLGAYAKGRSDEHRKVQAELLAKVESARKTEHAMQEKIDAARIEGQLENERISARLDTVLRELRNRPQRLPNASKSACTGSTGSELSGPDAEFLARESARADRLRAALEEREAWIETVRRQHDNSPR